MKKYANHPQGRQEIIFLGKPVGEIFDLIFYYLCIYVNINYGCKNILYNLFSTSVVIMYIFFIKWERMELNESYSKFWSENELL